MVQRVKNYWRTGLFTRPAVCAIALAGFFVFANRAAAQLTPPASFDINGSFAPSGASLSGQTVVSFANGVYSFSYSEGGNELARYELDTNNADVQKGLLRVREAVTNSFPMAQAGPSYRKLDGTVLTPRQFIDQLDVPGSSAGATFEHQQFGSAVSFLITHTLGGIETKLRYDFELKGKAFVVRASAVNPRTNPFGNYQGFILGPTENTPNPRPVVVPYMDLTPLIVFGTGSNQFFSSSYIDFTRSNSNTEPRKAGPSLISPSSYLSSYYTEYIPGESNAYPSFSETAYITVSGDIRDTFVKIHRPASAYRSTLTDRMVWDIWGDTYMWSLPGDPQVFPKIKVLMDISNVFRMDKLFFIAHVWQRFGYDCGLPNHVPANTTIPYLGTQAIPTVSATAASYGYLFALHENYVDMYPNSTYWNPSSVAREPNGSFRLAWNNPGCTDPPSANPVYPPPQSFRIATDKMVSFASQESLQIKNTYHTTAAYLDVSTTMPFNVLIDYSGTNPNASTIRQGFQNNLALNEYVRNVHQGPLLGEGAWADWQTATYQAGSVDGVEREIPGREFANIMPDFELREVKPLMANHGMGYPGRWVGDGTSPSVDPNLFFNQKSDKYRAMEIAYGHAGFVTDSTLGGLSLGMFTKYLMREYHLLRSLQSQYLGSDVAQVLYRNAGGSLIDLSQATKEGLNFQQAQIYEEYANGLKLYINFHPSQNWTVTLEGQMYILPPYGWVARNANTNYVNYSALTNGHRVDYVRSNEYIFADARGVSTAFAGYSGTFVTDIVRTVRPDGWAMVVDANGIASLFDAIAPTVSITAPPANAIVSGAATVTAIAADNVGVVGVQFLLDSQNLGVEDTTAPYEVSWDTTAAINGAHTLSARARDDAGNVATSPGVPVTVNNVQGTRPAAPTNLGASAVSQTQINLSWTDVSSNETRFELERGADGVNFTTIAGNLTANTVSYPDTGLAVNTRYYYRVRAVNAAGASDYSNTANAMTQAQTPTRPAAPSGLSAVAASPTQINLSWTNNATNATGIKIERSETSGTTGFVIIASNLPPNTVSFSDTGRVANTRYWYRVIAFNAAGDSLPSPVASATTPQVPDTTPPTVSLTAPVANATVSGTVSVRATATDNVGIAGIQFLLDVQNLGAEDTTAPYEFVWDTTGAANGTHRLSARARDGAGNTRVSADVPFTVSNIALRPNPPTNLAVQAVSNSRINLTWMDNATNETRYEIERSVNNSVYQLLVSGLAANTASYADTSVVENTLYLYRVRAANAAGASNYSNEASVRTPGGDNPSPTPTPAPLGAPANLRIIARSATQADFSWTDNATNEDGFRLEHSLDGVSFREVMTFPVNRTSHFYDGLAPGSLNYYRIRAYRGAAFSGYSNIATVRMPSLPTTSGPFTEELRFGSRETQVRLLQEFLIREGVYPEAIVSGYFGLLTQSAVIRFQGKYDLTQALRGVADASTRTKLNERYGIQPSPTPTPLPGGALTKNLFRGMNDSQVKRLQEWMNRDSETRIAASGVGSPGQETTYFGLLTEQAVQRFQKKYGIVSSGSPSTTGYGFVGPRTRAELNRRYGSQ